MVWKTRLVDHDGIGGNTGGVMVIHGKVLTGLARRILPEASTAAAGTPGEIEAVLKQF